MGLGGAKRGKPPFGVADCGAPSLPLNSERATRPLLDKIETFPPV